MINSVASGSSLFDSEEFKKAQRQSWNNAAAGWQEWWNIFENGATTVSNKLVELAEIEADHIILDLATGTGEPAVLEG